ncbi:TRAP transporter small permease [Parasalinivibrio latis]|uniref:TRAP transporter small permease n=1 Tax=Parasalinivibrio latis TaxID=2952610 RepID=UPI0030E0A286
MTRIVNWFRKAVDSIAVTMLAAMFTVFCAQIFFRYVLNHPLGWTEEVNLMLWLWLIFWAGAFCLKDRDHIRFDMIYLHAPKKVQKVFFLIASLAVLVGFAASFLPTWDYITFYKIKKSAILKIRLDYVFSIYGIFLGAIILRCGWAIYLAIRPQNEKQIENQQVK